MSTIKQLEKEWGDFLRNIENAELLNFDIDKDGVIAYES